ncbi:hypothetical protein PF005_g17004 [Phytophthora fragariae]|uniref:Uncharacterized protein n=2 Tax=Phytophthora fragariae TaxID=53985 RepID=A0A6A3X553_9STRA|nr:hypothetical protein PF005_g17004 [Phytophthora fragariae]KAE9211161.1 hypothetical protein PF004_g15998 [Phytophthora fragariae]
MKWNGATQNEGPTDMLMMLPAGMVPQRSRYVEIHNQDVPPEISYADFYVLAGVTRWAAPSNSAALTPRAARDPPRHPTPNADMGSRVKDNPTQYVRDEFCRMGFDDYDIVSRRLRRAEMPLKNNSLKLVNFPSAISYVRHKELK